METSDRVRRLCFACCWSRTFSACWRLDWTWRDGKQWGVSGTWVMPAPIWNSGSGKKHQIPFSMFWISIWIVEFYVAQTQAIESFEQKKQGHHHPHQSWALWHLKFLKHSLDISPKVALHIVQLGLHTSGKSKGCLTGWGWLCCWSKTVVLWRSCMS